MLILDQISSSSFSLGDIPMITPRWFLAESSSLSSIVDILSINEFGLLLWTRQMILDAVHILKCIPT
jgi:hypothetical protein